MGEENNKSQNENQPRRFSQQQYDLLKKCSDKKDMTEWNKWREENGQDVFLEGARFYKVNLEGADFRGAYLKNADFVLSHLEGANFDMARIHVAKFNFAFVNSETSFIGCRVDRKTDFRGVSLNTIRIKQETKQLLEYNIRRKNWEDWYKKHKILRWPVWLFWRMSDYGSSSVRIIGWFLGLALFFAAIYANFAFWYPPGIISHLTVWPHLPVWHYFLLLLFRPIYFSVITMTIGFGDMYANSQSIFGHILLIFQAILGYVLLGALITRLAVLFTGEGPAGKFADEKKKESTDNDNDEIS